jgi:hypothetical protein
MEVNIKICKKCNKPKMRVEAGRFPNKKDKKWKDEDDLLWNGLMCGSCNRQRSLNNMNKLRNGIQINQDETGN